MDAECIVNILGCNISSFSVGVGDNNGVVSVVAGYCSDIGGGGGGDVGIETSRGDSGASVVLFSRIKLWKSVSSSGQMCFCIKCRS